MPICPLYHGAGAPSCCFSAERGVATFSGSLWIIFVFRSGRRLREPLWPSLRRLPTQRRVPSLLRTVCRIDRARRSLALARERPVDGRLRPGRWRHDRGLGTAWLPIRCAATHGPMAFPDGAARGADHTIEIEDAELCTADSRIGFFATGGSAYMLAGSFDAAERADCCRSCAVLTDERSG